MPINIIKIERLVNSVGTNTFIKYFNEFQNLDREQMVQLFEQNNESWNENSKNQKFNNGKRIFNEGRVIEALEHIVFKKNEKNIPNGQWVKSRAKQLLQSFHP